MRCLSHFVRSYIYDLTYGTCQKNFTHRCVATLEKTLARLSFYHPFTSLLPAFYQHTYTSCILTTLHDMSPLNSEFCEAAPCISLSTTYMYVHVHKNKQNISHKNTSKLSPFALRKMMLFKIA